MVIEIEKAYLLVTNRCNDSCRYCIVRKGNTDMDEATILSALAMLFESEGLVKKVALYGGEPLLRFDLIEKTVAETRRLEQETGKAARTYVYTNGHDLDERSLKRLHSNDTDLILSLDVCQELRPERQRSEDHKRRFPRKTANLQQALDVMGPDRVCGASVLLPSEAERLMIQVEYMYKELGLSVVKILPGLGRYHWKPYQTEVLVSELNCLLEYLVDSAVRGRFLFFDLLNESLARATSQTDQGPARISVVEFYPKGHFGMSPCEFELPAGIENVNDTDRYHLGSLDRLNLEMVERKLKSLEREPRHSALRLMSRWTETVARDLVERSLDEEAIKEYIKRAKGLVFA